MLSTHKQHNCLSQNDFPQKEKLHIIRNANKMSAIGWSKICARETELLNRESEGKA
jgi:hypothetical protein